MANLRTFPTAAPHCIGPPDRGQRERPAKPANFEAIRLMKSLKKVSARQSNHVELNEEQEVGRFATTGPFRLSVFLTPLGWMGLMGDGDMLISAFVGHRSSKSVLAAAGRMGRSFAETDWEPGVRALFEAYADGEVVDFSTVKLQLPEMTAFRMKIISATRRLPYGETTTYGELAQRVGHPRAARAVGTVMSHNRFPIVIPCHRVLASGGKIGGYTSPTGIAFKQLMLNMEARGRSSR